MLIGASASSLGVLGLIMLMLMLLVDFPPPLQPLHSSLHTSHGSVAHLSSMVTRWGYGIEIERLVAVSRSCLMGTATRSCMRSFISNVMGRVLSLRVAGSQRE